MSVPTNLKYTKDHEWLLEQGGLATVGVTAHAQEQLGDVVFVDLPAVGTQIAQGASFGSVESVKAVSDLFAPVSGEIVEVNEALTKQPELINQDPYGGAWMVKIRPSKPGELASLLTPEAYDAVLAG